MALCGEEGEAHPAADQELVGHIEERLDDAELVAHLGTAQHSDEGPLGIVAQAEQNLDLALQQAACGGG